MNWASAGIQGYGEGETLNQQKGAHANAKQQGGSLNTGHGNNMQNWKRGIAEKGKKA